MAKRAGVLWLLLGCLATLTPLAHASLPDPSWIPGFYDEADFDDVVTAVTSASCVVDGAPLGGVIAIDNVFRLAPPADRGRVVGDLSAFRGRAPPLL